jgi:hypothetical protein
MGEFGNAPSAIGRWFLLCLAALLLSLFWRPSGVLLVTIALLVGGAALYQRSRDGRSRAIALGALGGGAVGAVILVVAVGYFAFAATVRQERGVETSVPFQRPPLQQVPTVTASP